MFLRKATELAILGALVSPAAAGAQEKGVTLDPDSPAGTEYQLPLEQARRDATPGGDGDGPDDGDGPFAGSGPGASPPLFGSGITRVGSESEDGPADVGGDDRGGGGRSGERGEGDVARPPASDLGSSRSSTAGDGGGSPGLTMGGVGLAVVVLGGAFGLTLRRGLGPPASP